MKLLENVATLLHPDRGKETSTNLLVHVHPLHPDAVLADVEERALHHEWHHALDVGVVAHHERVLAAQLQHHGFEGLAAALHHLSPNLRVLIAVELIDGYVGL